jgi:DNA-directed RNA polymerase specialized sigma24 family protein
MRVPDVSRTPAAQVRTSPDAVQPDAVQPGDVAAFESFYRAEVDRVYRALAVTLGDAHLAREAADEAMARAYMHWHRVAACDSPGGWVFRVGLNWATSWWRKFGRERPTLDEPLDESGRLWAADRRAAQGPAADRQAADRWNLERRTAEPPDAVASAALAALGRLPLAQRAVVVCRVLLDMTTVETAVVLGIAEGTVKSRLARGLAGLRRALGDDDEGASR